MTTQTTVLAAGTTAADSSDITVEQGESVKIGLFSAAGGEPPMGAEFALVQETPGADDVIQTLGRRQKACVIDAPGIYKIKRSAYTGEAWGVYKEV